MLAVGGARGRATSSIGRPRDRRGPLPASASTAAGGPSAILRPAFITTQRSQSERIASITCSTRMMVMPSLAQRADQRRCPAASSVGLRPASHSSSSSSSRFERQRAGQLEPLLVDIGELRPAASSRVPASPTRSSSASASARAAAPQAAARGRRRGRPATFSRHVSDCEHAHELEGARDAEPGDAMRGPAGDGRGRWKRIAPASGRSAPEIRLSTVVLPEPFGPIRPTISPRADREARLVDRDQAAEAPCAGRDLEQRAARSSARRCDGCAGARARRQDRADHAARQQVDDQR